MTMNLAMKAIGIPFGITGITLYGCMVSWRFNSRRDPIFTCMLFQHMNVLNRKQKQNSGASF